MREFKSCKCHCGCTLVFDSEVIGETFCPKCQHVCHGHSLTKRPGMNVQFTLEKGLHWLPKDDREKAILEAVKGRWPPVKVSRRPYSGNPEERRLTGNWEYPAYLPKAKQG